MTTKTRTPLIELRLIPRIYNQLRRNEIDTVEQLAEMSIEDLLDLPEIGEHYAAQTLQALSMYQRAIR